MSFSLSLLIPAFNYPVGVKRILDLCSHGVIDYDEIIISDDSTDTASASKVQQLASVKNKTRYIPNSPPLGPVANWNNLISLATGDYFILMHHDEAPSCDNFFALIHEEISRLKSPDVLVLKCCIRDEKNKFLYKDIPQVFRKFVVNFFPSYLFRRNVIGPPSVLVVKNDIMLNFDTNLQWFVDVDLYYRLRNYTKKWEFSSVLVVDSFQRSVGSITESLSSDLQVISAREKKYLSRKYPEAKFWLKETDISVLNAFEFSFWSVLRLSFFMYNFVAAKIVNRF